VGETDSFVQSLNFILQKKEVTSFKLMFIKDTGAKRGGGRLVGFLFFKFIK
jgi:hypothetical protein